MPAETRFDPEAILRVLARHGVDYIVVGGVCGILHGAPLSTFDVDIVHSRTPANIQRLLAALEELDACYRISPERRLRPSESHLSGPGHQLLSTRHGPLDVLGLIGKNSGFEELLPHTSELELDAAVRIRILDLDALIRVKQETAGEKDLAALAILRRLLEERSAG